MSWNEPPDYDQVMEAHNLVSKLEVEVAELKRRIEKAETKYREQYPRSPWKYAAQLDPDKDKLATLTGLLLAARNEVKRYDNHVKMYLQHWYNKHHKI